MISSMEVHVCLWVLHILCSNVFNYYLSISIISLCHNVKLIIALLAIILCFLKVQTYLILCCLCHNNFLPWILNNNNNRNNVNIKQLKMKPEYL